MGGSGAKEEGDGGMGEVGGVKWWQGGRSPPGGEGTCQRARDPGGEKGAGRARRHATKHSSYTVVGVRPHGLHWVHSRYQVCKILQ